MPKKAEELGAKSVANLKRPGLHPVGGVAGLGLQVLDSGARSWILRVMVAGKRRDMGLGGYPDVTLAGAREAARAARLKIKDGQNPIADARAARSALKAAESAAIYFDEAARRYIQTHKAGWKNVKHADQWTNTLETYAFPVIGRVLVRDVAVTQVIEVLEPIWTTKTETATRVRGRIEKVLGWATARGYRQGANPARWRDNLDQLLAKPSSVAKSEHHKALPRADMGAFMLKLRAMSGTASRALEFAILTAARSGEVRGATWGEIDMPAATWTISAGRMKAGREHRVPLSDAAVKLLKALPRKDDPTPADLVFPATNGRALSDMALLEVMRRMKLEAVPHGFRSTFRDWAAESTHYPREVAEMALAHAIGNKVEAAYRRGDLFDKRRKMMQDWAQFCGRVDTTPAVVIPILGSKTKRFLAK